MCIKIRKLQLLYKYLQIYRILTFKCSISLSDWKLTLKLKTVIADARGCYSPFLDHKLFVMALTYLLLHRNILPLKPISRCDLHLPYFPSL